MSARDSLEGLLKRVQEAQGPDRTIDAELATEVDDCVWDDHAMGWIIPGECGRSPQFPAYTQSIDAALALVERVLPPEANVGLQQNWWPKGHEHERRRWSAVIDVHGRVGSECDAPIPALALLSALLKALSAQHTREGGEG
jgi:hypothetical protein